jgi:ABC-2 type transport system permease protein
MVKFLIMPSTQTIERVQERFPVPQRPPDYDSKRQGFSLWEDLREVLRYRELVYQLVRRDIVARYKRSVMGIGWTMINPLAMMIVLTILFSQIFKTVPGFPAYVLSGLIAWTFFSQTTNAIINVFVWGGEFFQRIYLPRSTFAIAAIGTGLVNLLLSFIPLIIVMVVIDFPIKPSIIFQPIPVILFACFALGFGLIISSIAVFFPDVVEMYQIILLIWSYMSAIFYPLEVLPEEVQKLLLLNPMIPMIELFRLPIYEGKIPTLADLIPVTAISLVTLIVGWYVFTRKSDEFAYHT